MTVHEKNWEAENRYWAVIPVLHVANVSNSIRYYRDILGFTVDSACVDSEWTMLWADQSQLYLAAQTDNSQKPNSQVMICTPGIDDCYEEHRSAGADVVSELQDQPWGLRQYTVNDLDGNVLVFYSHIDTMYRPWKTWKESLG